MSFLQVTPAIAQVPSCGGTSTHILEAIGKERLAFRVKVKLKFYETYKVMPALGFIVPGEKRELIISRSQGLPSKTKLRIEYIVAPRGYDPRKPFIVGSEIGQVQLRIITYKDEKRDKMVDVPKYATGRAVTTAGQKFTAAEKGDEKQIEVELERLYKDQEKCMEILKKAAELAKKDESSSEEEQKDKKRDTTTQQKWDELLKTLDEQKVVRIKAEEEMFNKEIQRLEEIVKHLKDEIDFLRDALIAKVKGRKEMPKIIFASAPKELEGAKSLAAGKVVTAAVSPKSAVASQKPGEPPKKEASDEAVKKYLSALTGSPSPADKGGSMLPHEFSLAPGVGGSGTSSGYALAGPYAAGGTGGRGQSGYARSGAASGGGGGSPGGGGGTGGGNAAIDKYQAMKSVYF